MMPTVCYSFVHNIVKLVMQYRRHVLCMALYQSLMERKRWMMMVVNVFSMLFAHKHTHRDTQVYVSSQKEVICVHGHVAVKKTLERYKVSTHTYIK